MNTKLHAVTDARDRPIKFLMTAGRKRQLHRCSRIGLGSLPEADWLLAHGGFDANWYREALQDKGITPCIPGRKSRDAPVNRAKCRCRRRNRIEIMFGRLKDWRRVATCHDRCPRIFLSVALAATVIFWL